MNNGKTLAAAAVAATLAAPASHAAIDDAGMQYTSAAEGFYGSLRMKFSSGRSESLKGEEREENLSFNDYFTKIKATTSNIGSSASRLGVRGSVDLGGGLSANYQYEFGVEDDGGTATSARIHTVGLDGNFGSLLFGTQWALDYNYVWGVTDVMNTNSGFNTYNARRQGRQNNALTYNSPDFNGFNFGLGVVSDAKSNAGYELAGCGSFYDPDAGYNDATFTVATNGDAKIGLPEPAMVPMLDVDGNPVMEIVEVEIDGIHEGLQPVTVEQTVTVMEELTVNGDVVRDFAPNTCYYQDSSNKKEAEGIDKFIVAARYSIQGFDVSGVYVSEADTEDNIPYYDLFRNDLGILPPTLTNRPRTFGLALGYGQDNWSLDYYYANTDYNPRDLSGTTGFYGNDGALVSAEAYGVNFDLEEDIHSVAAQVQIGKATLRSVYETREITIDYGTASARTAADVTSASFFQARASDDVDSYTISVQYDLGSKSRTWIEYTATEDDVHSTDSSGFEIGYRVDF